MKKTKKLTRLEKRTISTERSEVLERQKVLRDKKVKLEKTQDDLTDALIQIATSGKGDAGPVNAQLTIIRQRIDEIDKELGENATRIEAYSSALKDDGDRHNGGINTATNVVTGLGALGLGIWSANRIYKTDLSGALYNKGLKDFFSKLSQIKIFGK